MKRADSELLYAMQYRMTSKAGPLVKEPRRGGCGEKGVAISANQSLRSLGLV